MKKCSSSPNHKSLMVNFPMSGVCPNLNPTHERSWVHLANTFSCVFKNSHPCLLCWKLTSSDLWITESTPLSSEKVSTSSRVLTQPSNLCTDPAQSTQRWCMPMRIKVSQDHGVLTWEPNQERGNEDSWAQQMGVGRRWAGPREKALKIKLGK